MGATSPAGTASTPATTPGTKSAEEGESETEESEETSKKEVNNYRCPRNLSRLLNWDIL